MGFLNKNTTFRNINLNYLVMKKKFVLFLFAALFISCSSDDDNVNHGITLKTQEVTLSYSESYQIEAQSTSKISYTSENKYHASVSHEGIITGGKVGKTNIILNNGNDTKVLKVIIEPKSNSYSEPNLEFGISKNNLIEKLGIPDYKTDSEIGYYNYFPNTSRMAYFFDTNERLSNSAIWTKISYGHKLDEFMTERYTSLGRDDNNIFVYINALTVEETDIIITAEQEGTTYYKITYTPKSAKEKL